jgi:spore maturation protein CgeB
VRIVLAGDWHSNLHERPMADAMERLGHSVERFAWHAYASGTAGSSLLRKAQNKFLVGPLLSRLNRDLIEAVVTVRADLLFVYRGTHVTRAALEEIRRRSPHTRLIGYNNDDPFAPGQPAWPWRHFIAAIPAYDRVFAYRPQNVEDFRAAGAKATGLLLPWFVPAVHQPVALTADERARYGSDVVFIGHYEDDLRLAALEAVAATGARLRLFGPGAGYKGHDWHGPLSRSATLRGLMPVHEVWDADYVKALAGSRLALCFLSKRNRDRYTRRCFEIPATGTMLLSEYSPELAAIYREGVEADYFRTPEELAEKVRYYLANPTARDAVAAQGRERAHRDGHDVYSRVRRLLEDIDATSAFERAG